MLASCFDDGATSVMLCWVLGQCNRKPWHPSHTASRCSLLSLHLHACLVGHPRHIPYLRHGMCWIQLKCVRHSFVPEEVASPSGAHMIYICAYLWSIFIAPSRCPTVSNGMIYPFWVIFISRSWHVPVKKLCDRDKCSFWSNITNCRNRLCGNDFSIGLDEGRAARFAFSFLFV